MSKKFLSGTILILKMRKSRSKRELLNLDKLFRKPSIILEEGRCGHGLRNYIGCLKIFLFYRKIKNNLYKGEEK